MNLVLFTQDMSDILLVTQKAPISHDELKKFASRLFGNLVKAVVDIDQATMAINGELHADEEGFLIQLGSQQKNLWGINLYPELMGDDFIEFDSMINLRPSQNNNSRSVEDANVQTKIRKIVAKLVPV